MDSLLQKQAIEPVEQPHSLGFYSRLFVVPKKTGGWRPVIDLSCLNKFLKIQRFKMETPESIRASLQPQEWVTSLDLKDAYLHIPVEPSQRKFLRFHVAGQSYQFSAMPFGLATAPKDFVQVMKEVKFMALRQGIRIHQYLDDWINRHNSWGSTHQSTQRLLELVLRLGLIVNHEKSELIPVQTFDFIGARYWLQQAVVTPTEDRVTAIRCSVTALQGKEQTTARSWMSLLGLLSATEKMVPQGRLHMRPLQWHLNSNWSQDQPLHSRIPVSRQVKGHLDWWRDRQNLMAGSPLHPLQHEVEIFTDASHEGWGAHCGQSLTRGSWPPSHEGWHINILEMKAVLLALQKFLPLVENKRVLISSDNTSVVSYINKQGGTRSWDLCALLWRLASFSSKHGIQLTSRHIPGRLNAIADKLSRRNQIVKTEWSLDQQVFSEICKQWGYPQLDLLATRWNRKCRDFVSPMPDPQAWGVDALSIRWPPGLRYAYPPTAVIPTLLNKFLVEQADLILIAPGWPSQSWFWDLVTMSVRVPMRLPPWDTLLRQPLSKVPCHHTELLNLHVWYLTNRPCRREVSVTRWQDGLLSRREPQPEGCTEASGRYSPTGQPSTKWTSSIQLFHK